MKEKVKKLKEDALTATKDAKKSRKKCTQLQMAIEETQELFHQERAKTRELEREGRYHQVERVDVQNLEQLDAYDCHQNLTEP